MKSYISRKLPLATRITAPIFAPVNVLGSVDIQNLVIDATLSASDENIAPVPFVVGGVAPRTGSLAAHERRQREPVALRRHVDAHRLAQGRHDVDIFGEVVDDTDVNRELVKLMLEPLGFDVREAAGGSDAIQAAQLNGQDAGAAAKAASDQLDAFLASYQGAPIL